MSHFVLFALMFAGGMAVALQPSINARLAQKVGFLESSCISFAVGTLALLAVVLVTGRGSLKGIYDAVWWELTGGFLGAMFVTLTIVAVPRIGTAAAMGATIAAQLTTGLILDHYGWFGFKGIPFDLRRMAGVLLLMLGALLLFKR
ncbi:DMT family transporter [Desulfatiglans anilini]|uniref:DMT family transporter n=1 Tax=Desulfatiglans anilini TaxID=90728 RepID=UPI00040E3FE8|nr:DMT family transporter [Desulfatiglans anilini]